MPPKLSFSIIFLGAFIAIFLSKLVHVKLGIGLNTIHLLTAVVDQIYPLSGLSENDTFGLKFYRYLYENAPNKRELMASIEDFDIDGTVRVRIYRPHAKADKLSPLLIYYHGGGWVLGSIASVEHIATGFASRTNFIVASVEYRLAPEHKFPVAIEDSLLATKWVFEHAQDLGIDTSAIAIGGDSAGGNIAAIVAQQLPHIVAFQLLIYPAIPTFWAHSASAFKYRHAPILSFELKEWFKYQYFNSRDDLLHPLACPLNDGNTIEGLAPALVITAEYDPLVDEGEEYARRLKAAGNEVTLIRYNDTAHGFFGVDAFQHGTVALNDAAMHLKNFFAAKIED